MKSTRVYDRYNVDTPEVTRLNPSLTTRGFLEPGQPLYVRMPVSDRQIERELMALRDDDLGGSMAV